jgi:D-alanyl-D-alanine carboxypeptidase (penicillin-binding protein 5/6)
VAKLLFPLLIGSNNNAAINLAEVIGKEAFVELMNLEAKRLGMDNTHFINPTGLESKEPERSSNYSAPKDLVKLAKYITFERPLIWEISIIKEFENIKNTNELLGKISGIIGGKTGETPLAGKCLLLVVQAPKNKGFIVNVIINSENHFEEMKKLINWTKYAYKW